MILFASRLVSAICLYLFLARANIYLTELEQAVLVSGYRFLLIFSPLLDFLFPKRAAFFGFLSAALACLFLCFHPSIILIFLFALGLSCGGFLIKKQAAETAQGAGFNKLALSLGSITAGGLLFFIPENRLLFFCFTGVLLTLSSTIIFFQKNPVPLNSICKSQTSIQQSITNSFLTVNSKVFGSTETNIFNWKKDIRTKNLSVSIWLFCGISIGIRVFGLFVILPQYLIHQLGALPSWYGFVIASYGAAVIISQMPAICKWKIRSFAVAVTALFLSCILLAFPQTFAVHHKICCLFWCWILAIEEIFAPYIDAEASKNEALLYKELGVGLGGALSVWMMRSFFSPQLTGLIGALALLFFFFFYRLQQKKQKCPLLR